MQYFPLIVVNKMGDALNFFLSTCVKHTKAISSKIFEQ